MEGVRPRRRTRGLIVALALLFAVAAGVAFVLSDGGAPQGDVPADGGGDAAPAKPGPSKPKPPRTRGPRVRAPAETEPAVDLDGAWKAALALKKAGKNGEALSLLLPLRRSQPAYFAEPGRAKILAEMEKALVDELLKVATSGSLEDVRKIAALVAQSVLDPALSKKAADALAAAEKTVASLPQDAGGAVVERAQTIRDKVALAAHLHRFAGEGPAPIEKAAIDAQIALLSAAGKLTPVADPLAIPDAGEAEKRRLEQLEQLRRRDVVGLLGNLGGALAWLALHQADDGHFGGDAAAARCAALKHAACDKTTTEKYPLAATGLAVLAFLDFRDQDRVHLFEPTLTRGVRWLLSQQEPDGAFRLPHGAGYSAAIALMALGQAASSARDPELVNAVTRGMNFYAGTVGGNGGWRYNRGQEGDLSVTGWYAQALEAAVHAGAPPPPEFRANLERFLGVAKVSETSWKYVPSEAQPRGSMLPVGMLAATILSEIDRRELPKETADVWRKALAKARPEHVYMLYYAVRVSYLLDGKLPAEMRRQLDALAGTQTAKGSAAGMFTLGKDRFFNDKGASIATAFATLTLEHALYRR